MANLKIDKDIARQAEAIRVKTRLETSVKLRDQGEVGRRERELEIIELLSMILFELRLPAGAKHGRRNGH